MTFIAALRHDRISAPWVIDGPINGELEKVLAPTLAKGEVVISRQPRQSEGQTRPQRQPRQGSASVLPAALQPRPHFDRAGLCQLKHLMRAAEPRDVEATWRKVGELLDLFSKQECANYLKKLRVSFRIKTSYATQLKLISVRAASPSRSVVFTREIEACPSASAETRPRPGRSLLSPSAGGLEATVRRKGQHQSGPLLPGYQPRMMNLGPP